MSNATLILYVDDSRDFRELVTIMLGKSGLTVRAFESVQEGTAWLETHQPAVIISDLNMAPMSGQDFMAAVRASARLTNIPCIFFSSDPLTQQDRGRLGAAASICKLRPAMLRSAVFALLGLDGRLIAAKIAVESVRDEIDRQRVGAGHAPLSVETWDRVACELAHNQRKDGLVSAVEVLSKVNWW